MRSVELGRIGAGFRRSFTSASCAFLLATPLISGCAGTGLREPKIKLRWPEPPLTTRIEHVRTINGSFDIAPPPSIWGRFVGFILGSRSMNVPLRHPIDVAVSPDGTRVYVSDFAQGSVHVYDLNTGVSLQLPQDQSLSRPFGLAIDSEQRLYVVEQAARQIRVLDESGATLKVIRSEQLIRPADIEIDEVRGRIYVADPSHQKSKDHYVRIFDLDGNYLGELGKGRGLGDGELLFPTYLAIDPEGNVYVSDTMNARISVFDADGEFIRTVGSRSDRFGGFDKPKGLAFDSFGNMYVVDSSWSNVQIFGPEDDCLLYFGGRGAYPGQMKNPTSIAIARESNTIFVGDYLNHRLGVYRLINTQAGDGIGNENSTGGTK